MNPETPRPSNLDDKPPTLPKSKSKKRLVLAIIIPLVIIGLIVGYFLSNIKQTSSPSETGATKTNQNT